MTRNSEGLLSRKGRGDAEKLEGRVPFLDLLRRLQAAMEPLADLQREIVPIRARFPRLDEQASVVARLIESQRQFAKALEGLKLGPGLAAAEKLARHARNAQTLDDAGWLPHHSTPFDRIDSCEGDAAALHGVLLRHYQERWPEVRRDIESRMTRYDVDEEAKATVRESLAAHEACFYRSVCRVLMPEIERVARAELHDGRLERIASQRRLRELAGKLPLFAANTPGLYSLNLYRRLSKHLYEDIRNEADLERFAQDPVPNRHAAVHGLVLYSSMQNSLNVIFMADYIFLVISVLKRLASAQAAK